MNFFERAIIKKINEKDPFSPGLQQERFIAFSSKINDS